MADHRPFQRWALSFFFLSGITGLIYEVLWTRRLTLTFGHTVLAVSTVLTAFMAGLALGSLLAGRWSDRQEPQERIFLKAYGALEFFVGVWAVLTLPLLGQVEGAYLRLATSGVTGTPLFLACFALSMLVLVPPTTAMGATVPVMSRLLVHARADVGRLLSRLYGVNTLGAVTGSGLAGFLLLPALGLRVSLLLAAAVNLTIGAAAMGLSRGSSPTPAGEPAAEPLGTGQGGSGGYPPGVVPLAFGLAGAASMAYQVAWTRALALSLGSSVYAFSAILVTFLTGLGLGSILYQLLMGRREPRLEHLAALELAVGALGGLTIPALGVLPYLFYQLFPLVQQSFVRVLAIDVGLCGLVLIAPTFLMGLAFPLATHLYTRDLRLLGRSVGAVYSANTFGCILGSFAAGFFLIPVWGAQRTLQGASALNLAVSVLLYVVYVSYDERGAGRRPQVGALLAAALAALVLLAPRWQPGVMAGGIAVYAERHQGMSLEQLQRSLFRPPAYYRDGLSCTVSVNYYGRDEMAMRVNGKVDASLGKADKQTMYLTGYLPGMLHPAPRKVFVVGLGSGLTLEALSNVPGVERVDCAELEPAVVEVGRYWKGFNGHVLEDPRFKMHLTDGRTFILGSSEQYDLIASEPSNAWIAGIGNLYTVDFYRSCRDHLAENGLMCQWFNLYAVSEADVAMVLHTFFEAFPEGMVWQSAPGDLLLLGARQPVPVTMDRIRSVWSGSDKVQRHFAEIGLTAPEQLLGQFLFTRERALQAFGQSPLNSDDRPLLEFSAPLSVYRKDQVSRNLSFLREVHQKSPPLPPGYALTPELLRAACFGWLNTANPSPVKLALSQLKDLNPDNYVIQGLVERLDNHPEKARQAYQEGLKAYPGDPALNAALGTLESDEHHYEAASPILEEALKTPAPGTQAGLLQALGLARMAQKQYLEASAAFYMASGHTSSSSPLALMGDALLAQGEAPRAEHAYHQALGLNPGDYLAWLGLAQAQVKQGHYDQAAESLRAELDLVPDDKDGLRTLALCYVKLNQPRQALAAVERAARYYPDDSELRTLLTQLRSL